MPNTTSDTPPQTTSALDPSMQEAEQLVADLGSHAKEGLSSAEAARRLAQEGPNTLASTPPVPGWKRFLAQFQDPLVYLLLAAVGITLVAWAMEGFHGLPIDGLVIAAVVALNALLGYLQEAKAADAAAALARMTEVTSGVLRDGQLTRIPSHELVRGDLLVLAEGDAVGADARLLQAYALRVQEASLTGESESVLKNTATLPELQALGDRYNMVYKGTAVAGGSGLAVVTATGMATQMGAIADMLAATKEEDTPLQKEVSRIGHMLGIAVLGIAAIVIGTLLFINNVNSLQGFITVLLFGVSLAVAAVPEGLPAILSVVLALGVQRMAKEKAIVKKLSSVETLGSASVICSDKTGTLTKSEMTVERVFTFSGQSVVTGVGYTPVGEVLHQGVVLNGGDVHIEHISVLSGGTLASNAVLAQAQDGSWQIQGDPTEAAFLVAERKLGVHEARQQRYVRLGEIPFDSDRKLMSTIVRDEQVQGAPMLMTKGAPDVLLQRCTHVQIGNTYEPITDAHRIAAQAAMESMSDEALRTLAVAFRPLQAEEVNQPSPLLEHDLVLSGIVGIIDPPRTEVAHAIAEAHRAGIRVIMITGDHPRTAQRIATDLGIVAPGAPVLTGNELDGLLAQGDAAFAQAVRATSVYARVAPAHKLRIVQTLQADGNIVAMTGDGVNDAPALKSADIGVAMGITGTEVSKEAARMILADDNFATIVHAVREGRGIFSNIRKFLRYLLSSNMGEVLTVFMGVLGASALGLTAAGTGEAGMVLPLLATQILWINLITDAAPALALGMDPSDTDTMDQPPRKAGDRVIDGRMWTDVFMTGLVVAVSTLLTLDMFLPTGFIEGTYDLRTARTAAFTVMVLAQLFNCFNARSDHTSAFHKPLSNPWLLGGVALSFVLQIAVVHVPVLNLAFGTSPLSLNDWLICGAISSSVIWYGELHKLVRRMCQK